MKTVPFPCLSVLVAKEASESAVELVLAMGATAVEERDETTMTGAGERNATLLIAGFPDAVARDGAAVTLSREGVEAIPMDVVDDGWSAGWRAFFRPVELERLLVLTPWMDVPAGDRSVIVIDPGLAFGTGGHATTRLVLELLERRAIERGLPAEVLDVGAGSGVLAIAAIKLGARRALAIDIDPASVTATRENAAANGIKDAIETRVATARDLEGEFPLVLANIELAAFRECAAAIRALVAPSGELFLSGLLEDQIAACEELFPGFVPFDTRTSDGWAALALRRSA
jgi:ribosomal protein L11 methyltransferase